MVDYAHPCHKKVLTSAGPQRIFSSQVISYVKIFGVVGHFISSDGVICHKSKWNFWVVLTSKIGMQGPIRMILVTNERSH